MMLAEPREPCSGLSSDCLVSLGKKKPTGLLGNRGTFQKKNAAKRKTSVS